MKCLLVPMLILFLTSGVCALETDNIEDQESVLIADQLYYWDGDNIGIAFTGKFHSRQLMNETLRLSKEIGLFESREWKLSDILVSMDLNANGDVASWEVSGPKQLLKNYLKMLEAQYKDRSLFYDLGFSFVNFKPSHYDIDGGE